MGITKKTKEDESSDPTASITNLKSALDDINARSAARKASQNASKAKLDAARIERSKQKKSIAGGEGSRLYGLASFSDRKKLT